MSWDLLADVATFFASISILVTIAQMRRELRTQNLNSLFYVHEYLSQEDFSRARKRIRTDLCHLPYESWSPQDRDEANRVCASYDQAGLLLGPGVLDKRTRIVFLESSWGQSIIDQYESLAPFLDDLQTPTRTGREFFEHFSSLYDGAVAVRRGRIPV